MIKQINSFGIIPLQKRAGKIFILIVKHVNGHYWGFPKGKSSMGEVPHETAIRELHEETGLEVKEMISGRLFHEEYSFESNGESFHKEVVYFPAIVSGEGVLNHPEEVEEIQWSSLDQLETTLTYGPSKKIAKEFRAWVMEMNI
jgi:8-oxo-dGTP pyrophosphatase MutT (NUDIX family)